MEDSFYCFFNFSSFCFDSFNVGETGVGFDKEFLEMELNWVHQILGDSPSWEL